MTVNNCEFIFKKRLQIFHIRRHLTLFIYNFIPLRNIIDALNILLFDFYNWHLLKSGHFPLCFLQLTDGMQNLDINDQNFPPPPPELLQQQFLYGTLPNTAQQPLYGQMAHSKGQGHLSYRPGAGQYYSKPTQRANFFNIPTSETPIVVEKRSKGQAAPLPPNTFKLEAVDDSKDAPPPIPISNQEQKPSLEVMDQKVLKSVDDHAIQVSHF